MRIRRSLPLALFLPAAVFAQSQPDPQRQILDRLQRLEEQNQKLMSEIHALREELAASGLKRAESTPPESPPESRLEERVAINEQRIDEQAQSKLEAEHKLPIKLTGMLLFNAYTNGRNSGGQEYPVTAALLPAGQRGASTDGATLRQSILGLEFQGPEVFAGGKVSGSLFMDFWGGTGTALNQMVRLRVATLDVAWANTTFSVGQDKPILSPREPTSLAQIGVSPLTGAGNLWLWAPQARVEQRFAFGEQAGLRAQAGVYVTSENSSNVPAEYRNSLSASRPGLESRFEFWRQFGDDRRIEIAPGFHLSESHVNGLSIPSRVFSVDWLIRPVGTIDFTGQFFGGQNAAVLGGLRQGLAFLPNERIRAVTAAGGWAQLTLRATRRLSFNVYGGQESDWNSDLSFGSISKNQTYAGNAMYRLGSNVIMSFETSQTRTLYVGSGLRLNPHYDLAIAYLY
jgi:hypothetical protein